MTPFAEGIWLASEPVRIVDELHVDGCRLDETVLVHRPSRTLVVADLVHNVGRPDGAWARTYTRAMGFYDRVALSRMLRWAAFSDRAVAGTARRSPRAPRRRSRRRTRGCRRDYFLSER